MKLIKLLLVFVLIAIVNFNLQAKADKDFKKFSKFILANKTEKVLGLIEKGKNINAKDDMGKTPLLYSLQLNKVDFAEIFFISALHGTKVGNLFPAINHAYAASIKKLHTPQLNKILQKLIQAHEPPLVKGRRIKIRYAHAGGRNPPLIILHGNQLKSLPLSYKRYLINGFRKHLNLRGTPIRIEYKEGKNPYTN